MKTFKIGEIDRDYHALTNVLLKEFSSEKEAKIWCDENSWTGYDYFVMKDS